MGSFSLRVGSSFRLVRLRLELERIIASINARVAMKLLEQRIWNIQMDKPTNLKPEDKKEYEPNSVEQIIEGIVIAILAVLSFAMLAGYLYVIYLPFLCGCP